MADICSPGARKALSQSLASFIPSIMQNASQIAARLELFRTETLAGFEPIDKKKEAANAEMDELLDETLGLQNLSIPDLHVDRSRAGLYIYLNAAVSYNHDARKMKTEKRKRKMVSDTEMADRQLPHPAARWKAFDRRCIIL